MNLGQIIDEINKDKDDDFEFTTLLGWVNRALDLASDVMNYEKKATLLLEEGVSDYGVPSDLMTLKHVIGSSGELNQVDLLDQTSTGYKRWGNIIGFQNLTETAVDMYYYGHLPHLVDPVDVPALPFQFHNIPVLYAVSKAKYQDE
ncbi:phage adaptor protein [Peribacillus butanolivorans]